MLNCDNNQLQEVIFEIVCLNIYGLHKSISQPVIYNENAKVAVFVGNPVCFIYCCMGSSNVKI